MTKIGSIFCLIFFISTCVSAAGQVQVNGLVESNDVGVGQQFLYSVEVSSGEAVNSEDPTVPVLDGMKALNMSTSSSTSTKMVQGQNGWQFDSVRKVIYTFNMVATKKGNLTIPPFTVAVDGKNYQTKPVQLHVSDHPSQANRRGRPGIQQGLPPGMPNIDDLLDDPDELYNQLLQRRFGQQGGQAHTPGGQAMPDIEPPKNPNELLSIQTVVDKRQVYEGEQITVSWYLLVRGNLISLDRTKFPDLKGFWKEIIEEVPALQFQQEVINGQVYRRALLASHALFPIKDGTAMIDEFQIKGQVQVPTSSFGLGGGPAYTFTRSSERIPIKVLPLPKEGRPQDFTGAVGQFNVQAILENNILPVNQPFSLKIRFEGSGNAKLIEMPAIQWPASLEVYDTKQESKFFKNGQSYKQFDITLIPRQVGEITTPPISVSLFDPQKKTYYTRTIEPIQLKVQQGSDTPSIDSQRVGSAKKVEPAKPQMPAPVGVMEAELLSPAQIHWALGAFYLFVFGFLGNMTYQQLLRKNLKKDLAKVIKNRVKMAEAAAHKSDHRKAAVIMVNLMGEVLGEISGQGGSDREIAKMLELSPPSVRRNLGADIAKLADTLQTLSFAPEEFLGKLKGTDSLMSLISETRKTLEKAIAEAAAEQE